MLLGIFDWIGDFFKSLFDLIPKVIYLLYASLACVLDVLQLFFRKLAGLDVYYVDGKAVAGDLVTNFITGILGINADGFTYSALSTVFWAFIVFGVIMCFMTTIVAIVKSHYSYDEKAAKGPMQYVYTAGKAVLNMVAVPIIVVLGLYLSQAILTALDTMTSVSSGNVVTMYGEQVNLLERVDTSKTATGLASDKDKTYVFYDIFGFGASIAYGPNVSSPSIPSGNDLTLIGSSNQTFSGSLFKVAAYNANRARIGTMNKDVGNFSGASNDSLTLFANAKNNDELADMIDTAFACNLHLKQTYELNYSFAGKNGIASTKYFTNYYARHVSSYSKFNVGLVWYYYDLWSFNFIVGFAGCIVCATLFINIIMGLIARLFMCIGLFLVAPPLFGLAPLDGGKAGKSWQENFMKQVLMAYGAVVGMNIFFLILPYMNEIDFFNIAIADYFAQTLIIIVGLITIKAFIATLSGLIGAADANETGGKISEEVGQVAGKATAMTVGAAKGVIKAPSNIVHGGIAAKNKMQEIKHRRDEAKADKKLGDVESYQRQRDALTNLKGKKAADVKEDKFMADYIAGGGTEKEGKKLWKTIEEAKSAGGKLDDKALRKSYASKNKKFNENETRYSGLKGGRQLAKDNNSYREAKQTAATLKNYRHGKYERHKGGLTGLKDTALTPFKNLDSIMDDSKLYSAYKEKSGIKPKVDWTKEGAEATQNLLTETRGGRQDLRTGFDNVGGRINTGFRNTNRNIRRNTNAVNDGFANTNASLGGLRGDVNAGMGGITSDIAEANRHLEAIEHDTEKTKKATQRISHETDGLKSRQKKVIEQNEQAHKDRKKAEDKLKVLVDDSKNRRKPKI